MSRAKTITFLTTLFFAVIMIPALAYAQNGARVYLQIIEATDTQVVVEVTAENVSNMYGAEFELTYDPAIVAVQDTNSNQDGLQVEPGSLLSIDQGFVVANKVDEAEGSVVYAVTLLNPAPAVNGSGPLARVTFNRLQPAPLTLNVARAKLVSSELQTIPSTTESLPVPGSGLQQSELDQQSTALQENALQQSVEPAAPAVPSDATSKTSNTSDFPWWVVAAAVMIIGVLGLGVLIIVAGSAKAQQEDQTQDRGQQYRSPQQPQRPSSQQPHRQRSQHVPGTRPSAFK